MSGPKLSAAELERLRQEQLERERQEYLRRLKEAQHIYRDAYNKAAALKAYAMDSLQKIDVSYSADAKRDIAAILSHLILHDVADDKDPQAYHQAAQKINEAVDKVTSVLEDSLNKYNLRSKADQKLGKADVMHQSFQAFLGTGGDPVDVKKLDFSSNYDGQQLQKMLNLVLQHYKWLLMYGKTDAEKKFAKKSLDRLKDIMAKSSDLSKIRDITSSVQAMINEEADIRRRLLEAAALYDDYVAVATMMDIVPKLPIDFTDIQMMKEEIDNLTAQYRKKDEMDYIADQINDAMISLGYGFVTSRVLTRKDRTEMDCESVSGR